MLAVLSPCTQILRRNTRIHRAFLGSAVTQQKIATDPTFLPSLGKTVNGIATGSIIYAGGAHGRSGRQAVEPLQQYATKISLYGQRKPSVRVSEVWTTNSKQQSVASPH